MHLARVETGTGPATPLLIAHGLFGSARNWGVIQKRLADRGRVVAVDMRNHAGSPWDDDNSYPAMASDLAAIADGWDIVGHSMGGKAAMVAALTHPGRVRRLVVADIAPVAYGHTQMPLLRAMQALDLDGLTLRSEADRRLAASVEDPTTRAFLLQSLDVRQRRWRLNLPALAANMELILGFPDLTGVFTGPVLFLSGGASGYVLPEHRDRIRALFPNARFARIRETGHWLHAEQPRAFEASVRAFLDR